MAKVKKMGLALGGGSARGFAHIGVLRVMIENRIPIDSIAGCSMGALIGGIYASEADLETLENLAVVFDYKKYFDLTLSSKGYVKGSKVQELIKLMTKNSMIEKSKIPYCCIATCLCDAKLKRFTEGPIHEAVRASISIPGMFTPHVIDGVSYVDGGVIDRTAIDAAWAMGPDVVVAVDVGYRGEKITPPKSIIGLAQASFSVADWHLAQTNLPKASMCIFPDVSGISGSQYKDIQDIIARGEEAAHAALPQIKELIEIK
ncbi:patatin-like phospholipase family protein [Christensenella tenuis]|uniref:Patatin-like phospholipase family protein n=1 Tax=Christensenella tenuis TaxID=2763033 RepID=A0ABR7EDS5_9FIRM|nr:patatin-like phospholipase family protein [Christensenella tenuis]MBC5647239.1 patatin-like phospholipase family protein [Christensenella tenuis]